MHQSAITSLQITPDLRFLVTGSCDWCVSVYEFDKIAGGEIVTHLAKTHMLNGFACINIKKYPQLINKQADASFKGDVEYRKQIIQADID